PPEDRGGSRELHQPGGGRPLGLPDLVRGGDRAAARGSQALRDHRQFDLGAARRADAGGAAQELAGGEFQPGRRVQGHLGAAARGSGLMLLARHAEAAFWMARYVERAENLARLLDVQQVFANDSRDPGSWRSILALNADEARFVEAQGVMDRASVTQF